MNRHLSAGRFLRRDPTARGLCTFAIMLWAIWGVMIAVLDRDVDENRTGLAVLFAVFALITAIFAVILWLKLQRLRTIASVGKRVMGRVTHRYEGTSKKSGYMLVEYVIDGRTHQLKYVTITPPQQQVGDEFELVADPRTPERVVPHHLFESRS